MRFGTLCVIVLLACAFSGCVNLPNPELEAAVAKDRADLSDLSAALNDSRSGWDAANASVLAQREATSQLAKELVATRALEASLNEAVDGMQARLDQANADSRALQTQLSESQQERADLRAESKALRDALAQANRTIQAWEQGKGADERAKTLQSQLDLERARADGLQSKYDDLIASHFNTVTTVNAGNVTWHFVDLRGSSHSWTYSLDAYKQYVQLSHPYGVVRIQAGSTTVSVNDPRSYIVPSFFSKVISDLTSGRNDHQFVREAFNVKKQMVIYNNSLADENGLYKFPSETLTEGTGICGDTTILLASLLLAGNATAKYGYNVSVWLGDLDTSTGTLVEDAPEVNHAFVEVSYADGSSEYIETTATSWMTYSSVWGWELGLSPKVVAA